jgi:hypothetical protein
MTLGSGLGCAEQFLESAALILLGDETAELVGRSERRRLEARRLGESDWGIWE